MHKLKLLWTTLEGKRTYALATITAILNILLAIYPTLLTTSQLMKLDAVLIALGGAAIHSAIVRN